MDKTLVVVESPAKAKTIKKYLGAGYEVKASVGHIKDLPQKELGVRVDEGFAPEYQIITGKEKLIKELSAAAQKAARVFLATDPDREGEAIAWHLREELKKPAQSVFRVLFNELTEKTIKEAIAHPSRLDEKQIQRATGPSHTGQNRRVSDQPSFVGQSSVRIERGTGPIRRTQTYRRSPKRDRDVCPSRILDDYRHSLRRLSTRIRSQTDRG